MWGVASRISSKQHEEFPCSFHRAFSQIISPVFGICCYTVVLFMATSWNNKTGIIYLSANYYQRSDFQIIGNLSIAVHVFHMHLLKSLLVDEILLPKYVNCSANLTGLSFNFDKASSCLKSMNSILPVFT